MRTTLVLLALSLAAGPAWPQELPPRQIPGPIMAKLVKVRDGDTVEVEAYVWPLQTVSVAVRLRNVDAPELRGECEAERQVARAAQQRLIELAGDGPVELRRVSGDKYFGRVLANLSVPDGPDIGAQLLKEGLVDAYDGGRRRNWCATARLDAPSLARRG